MRRRTHWTAIVVLGLLFATLGAVLAAPASPSSSSEAPFCVVTMVPITEPPTPEEAKRLKQIEAEIGKPIVRERPGPTTCYESEQQFEDAHPQGVTSSAAPDFAPASYVLAHLYEHTEYNQYQSGRAQAYSAALPCSQQAHAFYYVGDYMNDRTSSGFTRRTNGCNGGFRFYRHADLVDGPYLCGPECPYVPSIINDQVSSMIVY